VRNDNANNPSPTQGYEENEENISRRDIDAAQVYISALGGGDEIVWEQGNVSTPDVCDG